MITVERPTDEAALEAHPKYVVQVASSTDKERTRTLAEKIGQQLSTDAFLESTSTKHRLMLGPFNDYSLTQSILDKVKSLGYSTAFIKKHKLDK